MRRALFILLLAATGCGNWSDLDAEFLAGVPRREDLTLTAPANGTAQQGLFGSRDDALLGQSTVYREVLGTVNGINSFVAVLTGGIDFVRTLPPTARTDDARAWGPYPDKDHPGFEIRIVITREPDPIAYRYELQFRRQGVDFASVVSGRFEGDRASNGTGSLTYHADAARNLGLPTEDGIETMTLTYDMTSGADTGALRGISSGAKVDYQYDVEPDGGGAVDATLQANLFGSPLPEKFHTKARWLADKSGRTHADVSEGDISGPAVPYDECWGSNLIQTWRDQHWDCGGATPCVEGFESDCTVPPLQ